MTTDPHATENPTLARLYLKSQARGSLVLNIPGTDYQLHLRADEPVTASPQGRVRGVVRLPVWKVDTVTPGGAFIEPLLGRPRRVQGTVIGTLATGNSLIVEVCGQPLIGDLPARWNAASFIRGSRVGLDVKEGGTFEPAEGPAALELGPSQPDPVNLRV